MSPLLLLVVFALLVYYLYKSSKERPPNFPPGPPRLPIWGSYWFVLWKNFKYSHRAYHMLAEKYKTKILGLHLGPLPTVVVHDYENVKEVLTRPEFQGRVHLYAVDARTYNKNLGVIFTDDDYWTEQRRFSLRHMRDFGFGRRYPQLEGVIQEEIQDMLDLLHGRREDKDVFKNGLALVPDIFHHIFFNGVWSMVTGQRFSVKEHDKLRFFTRQSLRFQRSVDVTGNAIAFTPWIRHFIPKYSGWTDLIDATRNLLKYMENAVAEHLKSYSDDYVRDFIDQYIKEMKMHQKNDEPTTFSEEQLRVVGIDYLFPASTTVTATLNFAMAFLLNYPEVQAKIQKELDEVVGRDRKPTLDDRTKLPYNEAFLREVMRRETLVPLSVVHRATEDTELGGYSIPKDTAVVVNLWSFHNDPEFWGDPEVFRPERFLDENGQLLKKDYTLPFGAGKRLCAGETYARHYMFLTLASLLQNFTVKGAPGKPIPHTGPDYPGIIVTKENMWLRFEPRS